MTKAEKEIRDKVIIFLSGVFLTYIVTTKVRPVRDIIFGEIK